MTRVSKCLSAGSFLTTAFLLGEFGKRQARFQSGMKLKS